jgi:hypothetical protein
VASPVWVRGLAVTRGGATPTPLLAEEVPVHFRPVVASRWPVPLCLEFARIFFSPADWQSVARGGQPRVQIPNGIRHTWERLSLGR